MACAIRLPLPGYGVRHTPGSAALFGLFPSIQALND